MTDHETSGPLGEPVPDRESRRPPRAGCVGFVVMYDEVTDVVLPDGHTLAVGDRLEAVRGNGIREGQTMGTVTVSGFEDDGLQLHFEPRSSG